MPPAAGDQDRAAVSTTSGQLEHEPTPEAVAAVATHHKKLAPKVGPSLELPHEKSSKSRADQQPQEQGQLKSPQFAFINTTTDVQYSGPGSRSVARSHVMRDFHRKKGQSRLRQPNSHSSSTPRSLLATTGAHGRSNPSNSSSRAIDADDPGLHRLDENAMRNLAYSGEQIGVGNNSALWQRQSQRQERHEESRELPMSNLWALPVDAHATELIYHYIQIFAKTFVPVKQTWESEWFVNALSDPACFHGTLFLSAAHKALLTRTEDSLPVECFQHKGEAIRIINERLSDPTRRVTDGTIAAIACLAAFETLSGTATDATVHVEGLEKLVVMRGGLKQLGMDGFLEQFLYWVDLSNATATKERPHFVPFEAPLVYSRYSDSEVLWKYCDSQWNEEILISLPVKSYQGLDFVENRLFHRLRQLIVLAASSPSMTKRPSQQAYANSVLLLERQIGVAVQERVEFRKRFGAVTFSPPTCLFYIPTLIICYMILRPIPARSSIYGPLVTRMMYHMDHLTPRQLFDRFPPEFWFWALLFVGAASMGRPQQACFQRLIAQLCNLLDIHSWEKAKVILEEFAWADSICERPCKAFWDTLKGIERNRIEEEVDIMDHTPLPIYS